jgi:hypothetical protein
MEVPPYLLAGLQLVLPVPQLLPVLLVQRLQPLGLVLNQQVALLVLHTHTDTHGNTKKMVRHILNKK